jgi:hypothetical protein
MRLKYPKSIGEDLDKPEKCKRWSSRAGRVKDGARWQHWLKFGTGTPATAQGGPDRQTQSYACKLSSCTTRFESTSSIQ